MSLTIDLLNGKLHKFRNFSGGTGGGSGFTGNIGNAEDGDYTDGLFTDFTPSTPIGTAIDRFNEVLAQLAPTPAPDLDDLDNITNGVNAKLSFGTSKSILGYTNVLSLNSPAGVPNLPTTAVNLNGTFSNSGNRLGVIGGGNVQLRLNEDVNADSNGSYPANSFGNADQGEIVIYLNNVEVLRRSITALAAVNENFENNSTLNLSAAIANQFSNGNSFNSFRYRTGTVTIRTADFRRGHNFLRIEHDLGSTINFTNYIEWVYDDNSDALSSSNESLFNLNLGGSIYISGVEYFTTGNVQYSGTVSNAYTNVFSPNNINNTINNISRTGLDFTGNGLASNPVTSNVLPDLNTTINSQQEDINFIASYSISTNTLIGNDNISASLTFAHPLKSNLTTSSQSESDFLFYTLSDTSTLQNENFSGEDNRIIDVDYSNNGSVTYANVNGSLQAWSSIENVLTSAIVGNTGLVVIPNNDLVYPNSNYLNTTYGISNGNFNLTNGPIGNVDYGAASGNLTYVRKFRSRNTGSLSRFTIVFQHNNTVLFDSTTPFNNNPSPLSNNEVKVEFNIIRNPSGPSGAFNSNTYNPFFSNTLLQDDVGVQTLNQTSTQTSIEVTLGSFVNNLRIGDTDILILRIIADSNFNRAIQNISILEF